MKSAVKGLLRSIGYDLVKLEQTEDLSLYTATYGEEAVRLRQFYNVGAGSFSHPCWTNIDWRTDWYAHQQDDTDAGAFINYDLLSLEPVPVEDNTAQVIYSSHTVEHITDEAAAFLLKECHRMLRPGGIVRLTMPNIELDYRAYLAGDRNYFYWTKMYSIEREWKRARYAGPLSEASIQQLFLHHFAASASEIHADGAPERISDQEIDRIFADMPFEQALDYCVSKCSLEVQRKYPGNHINWWTPEKAFRSLNAAGFEAVYQSGYGQSQSPVLRDTKLFDNTHPKLSMYVEAVK